MYWRCLNRSSKTNTNDGRTLKHSEYHYAKCQPVLWKCQMSYANVRPGNTKNLCSYLRTVQETWKTPEAINRLKISLKNVSLFFLKVLF